MKSKVNITEIGEAATPFPTPANGTTSVNSLYINANPFVGYRFNFTEQVKLDVLGGFETFFILRSYEEGKALATNGKTYKINNDIKNNKTDNRLKIGLAAYYNNVSFTASYAHGLTDYTEGIVGQANHGAYTNVIRLGIGFRAF